MRERATAFWMELVGFLTTWIGGGILMVGRRRRRSLQTKNGAWPQVNLDHLKVGRQSSTGVSIVIKRQRVLSEGPEVHG